MKKTVFLTGASGNMGQETLKQLLSRSERFYIVALVLPTEKDKKIMSSYQGNDNLKIIWGDLTSYDDVFACVMGADYVLHIGGMVSPMADYYPELTTKVNVGGAKNIIKAIQSQPNRDEIKLVYIGTVAQTGDRNPPIHWGRTGDPIKISKYDNYAITKTIAEREVIESGLKYWVSLRQTGILYPNIADALDPIMYHLPVQGVFEWVTVKDSGRIMANACEDNLPEEFWRRIYNIGGGEKYRTFNYDFLIQSGKASGIADMTKMFELNWFATQNFHGQWYEDSDELEKYLKFRTGSIQDHLEAVRNQGKVKRFFTKLIPSSFLKKYVMKPVAYKKKYGTMDWIKNNNTEKIDAYFGSKKQWSEIPTWEKHQAVEPSKNPIRLSHGYDESKPKSELDIQDINQAAAFRGGKSLSTEMKTGDLITKLKWECVFKHTFEASPMVVLLGGHWCPECIASVDNYEEEARYNPFFNQVWSPIQK
ncbi:MAG TPA: NAD-dependent epimerase/dehydratase family protein [Flavobacterium sp.]|uniref:NAD-dependent epimerase/dehydratase family protein n=1 Tax=Flavobacterium sp. TaxID=239 RepID=UPI002DB5FB74|nr:NAD-dependent epimerase/dehydratase family protein [Flavobacterium sp.]HEU4790725.1 NAD-dependent epimerase/dehydratase family protein [Flavobacterium sp.]